MSRQKCNLTREELRADGCKSADDCPLCLSHGDFKCAVDKHRSELSVQEDILASAYGRGYIQGICHVSMKRKFSTDNKTLVSYAKSVKESLGSRCVRLLEGGSAGDSFLSEDERDLARKSIFPSENERLHERHLVAYMTPIFMERLMATFPSHHVLVNCEEYRWLPQQQNPDQWEMYLTPDQFICPHYLVKFLPPYTGAPLIKDGNYGLFPVMGTRRSLRIIGDCKKKLDENGEYDLMKYLENVSMEDCFPFKGFVYDWERCTLMTATNGIIMHMVSFKWTTPGTRKLMTSYFQDVLEDDDWNDCLESACAKLGVTIPRYSSNMISNNSDNSHPHLECILGSAKTTGIDEGTMTNHLPIAVNSAIKLVIGEECCERLQQEYDFYIRHLG
eukprot:gene40711-53861_t